MSAVNAASEDYLTHYLDLTYYKWVFVLSIGAFLALFMIVFQPFGVSNYDPDFRIDLTFLFAMCVIGAVISAVLAVNEFILRPLLLPAPTRGQLVGWLAWVFVLTATAAFMVYNILGDWHDFHWLSWLGFVRDVGMVTAFPVAGFLFYIRHESLQSKFIRLTSLAVAQPSSQLLHLSSDNDKDLLAVAMGDLLYLESQDNYLAVVYLDNGKRRTHLIRSSLKRIEARTGPELLRCHRSFMVNLQRVRACHGNQHGLKLSLDGIGEPVPVSRNYTQAVLARLGGPARH